MTKQRPKKGVTCLCAVLGLIGAWLLVTMVKDHSYPPVKQGISRKEAERIVDENAGEYFLVKRDQGCTSMGYIIAYGEYAGIEV